MWGCGAGNSEKFLKEARLIRSNAQVYNVPESEVCADATMIVEAIENNLQYVRAGASAGAPRLSGVYGS